MSIEENKAVVRRFYTAFEKDDEDGLEQILSPELVAYNLHPQHRDEHIQGIRVWNAVFSENRFDVIQQIAEGDTVVSHVTMHCVHSKTDFQGIPPTGKHIEIGALTLERIRDGKIVERRIYSDRLGMLRQLNLLPPG